MRLPLVIVWSGSVRMCLPLAISLVAVVQKGRRIAAVWALDKSWGL